MTQPTMHNAKSENTESEEVYSSVLQIYCSIYKHDCFKDKTTINIFCLSKKHYY